MTPSKEALIFPLPPSSPKQFLFYVSNFRESCSLFKFKKRYSKMNASWGNTNKLQQTKTISPKILYNFPSKEPIKLHNNSSTIWLKSYLSVLRSIVTALVSVLFDFLQIHVPSSFKKICFFHKVYVTNYFFVSLKLKWIQ